jgi:NADPH:quinone reductase-like Zn-dependent oxidoreductase
MPSDSMMLYRLRRAANGRLRLSIEQDVTRRPGSHEVRVRLRAASLNYRDLMVLDGRANAVDGLIPLSDGAGEVDAIGDGVTQWVNGDRVVGLFFQAWMTGRYKTAFSKSSLGGNSQNGMLSEYVILPESGVADIGSRLTWQEAATLPCAALTAWQAMFERTRITSRDTVLILGTGGVASFAMQFAHAVGARTIVLSSSPGKLARMREFGATTTIDYTAVPEWDKAVLEATDGEGATLVIENGGPATFGRSLTSLAPGGRIAQVGVLTGFGPTSNLMRLQNINADIMGITVGSAEHFRSMLSFIEQHRIVPIIDKTFDFADASHAYTYLREALHVGKVVISFK